MIYSSNEIKKIISQTMLEGGNLQNLLDYITHDEIKDNAINSTNIHKEMLQKYVFRIFVNEPGGIISFQKLKYIDYSYEKDNPYVLSDRSGLIYEKEENIVFDLNDLNRIYNLAIEQWLDNRTDYQKHLMAPSKHYYNTILLRYTHESDIYSIEPCIIKKESACSEYILYHLYLNSDKFTELPVWAHVNVVPTIAKLRDGKIYVPDTNGFLNLLTEIRKDFKSLNAVK